MKILYIIRGPFGLLGTNASYMFPTIVARHHEVMVLEPEPSEADLGRCVKSSTDLLIRHIRRPYPERLDDAVVAIERFDPDVVHVFYHLYAFLFPFVAKRSQLRPRRWVLDIRSPMNIANAAMRADERKRNGLLQLYYDRIATHATPSVRTVIPFNIRNPVEVPLGVDLDLFPSNETEDTRQLRKFVFIGSIAKVRRIDLLVDAFGELARHFPDVTLDVYGDGNDAPRLRQRIEMSGLTRIIKMQGLLPQDELFGRLHSYDVGVGYTPKGDFDNAPSLKVLEYAAAGLPILATNTRYNQRFCREGYRMSLFDNTVESFVDTASHLIYAEPNPGYRAANLKAVEAFDWKDIVANKLLPLYDELAG